ncbi:hypothetical protein SJT37_02715 [Aeromonas caviae]|uniref:hypothetical protein n=1 Tax=Aeromonas caviae TaxID=648 RepID=UPI0029D6ECB2|nr:hypothetical protein [Aeromonas caviae]MDX7674486.1 hypothetical protein [Aeromonas caviae]
MMIYLQKRVIDQNGRSPSSTENSKIRCGMTAVSDINDHKEKFKKISINAIGDDKSSNILHEQRRLINKISGGEELWVDFVNVVQQIMSNS